LSKYSVDFCFLILAHHRPNQLNRLVRSIASIFGEKASFVIHVDKKSDISEFVISDTPSSTRVDFLNERFEVDWGGLSIVKATVALLNHANNRYLFRHVILISGEDAVVNADSLNSLGLDTTLMNYWILPHASWWGGGMFRIDRPHFFDNKIRRNLNFKLHQYLGGLFHAYAPQARLSSFFPDMVFYGGQQWMALSQQAVAYLLQFVSDHPKIWDVFKYSFAPDELFIQTILCNNKSLKIVNKPTHYVRFNGFDSSPDYLTLDEIDSLRQNGDYLFARKYAG